MNELYTAEVVIEIINKHYDLGKIDYCMFVRRGFNDTYLVDTGHQKYIFRVYLNGKYYVDSNDAYRFELNLLKHLHLQNVPVAIAVPTVNGDLLGVRKTEKGQRAFALFHYAEGISLSREAVTTNQSHKMGVALANLHLAADSFETQYGRYKLDLKYLIEEPLRLISEGEKSAEFVDDVNHGLQIVKNLQPIERYIDRLKSIGTECGNFGIIHADLHLANVHFRGEELTIFDFDHCAYGWRAYDLAISSYLPMEQRSSMIEGYESIRPLSPEERDSLSDLGNLRNLWDIGDILATTKLRENDV